MDTMLLRLQIPAGPNFEKTVYRSVEKRWSAKNARALKQHSVVRSQIDERTRIWPGCRLTDKDCVVGGTYRSIARRDCW